MIKDKIIPTICNTCGKCSLEGYVYYGNGDGYFKCNDCVANENTEGELDIPEDFTITPTIKIENLSDLEEELIKKDK